MNAEEVFHDALWPGFLPGDFRPGARRHDRQDASLYRDGRRSDCWLKIKAYLRQEAVIAGFTRPRNSRKHFGAFVVGVYDGNELVHIGEVGGGFSERSLAQLSAELATRRGFLRTWRAAGPMKMPLACMNMARTPLSQEHGPMSWLSRQQGKLELSQEEFLKSPKRSSLSRSPQLCVSA
jgi:hypothetical protein